MGKERVGTGTPSEMCLVKARAWHSRLTPFIVIGLCICLLHSRATYILISLLQMREKHKLCKLNKKKMLIILKPEQGYSHCASVGILPSQNLRRDNTDAVASILLIYPPLVWCSQDDEGETWSRGSPRLTQLEKNHVPGTARSTGRFRSIMSQDILILESFRPNMAEFKLMLCVVIIYCLKI